MNDNKIISKLRIKEPSGFVDYNVGPELKYTGSLSTSNNNNLEEQMLIDVDKITTSYFDTTENAEIESIEFRKQSDTVNFYRLNKIKYTVEASRNVYIENDEDLVFNTGTMEVASGSDILEQINYDPNMTADSTGTSFELSVAGLIEKDTLDYKDDLGNQNSVSEKNVYQEIVGNKVVIREVITNKLT